MTAPRLISLLCCLLLPAAVAAQPPEYLGATPIWTSSAARVTRSVAVGDVNGDGYLDLVFGNVGQRNTLYWGGTGGPSATIDWESPDSDSTHAVALGDINGDGWPDLVCGRDARENVVYFGNGTAFDTTPGWESTGRNNTFAIALGDLNNDRALDLVCANEGQPNTVYLNTGGSFSALPDWTSLESDRSLGVALGDIDDDGFLDAVFANDGQPNRMYRGGVPGVLDTMPAWTSQQANRSFGVSIGDINGDGELDLAFGNVANNTAYLTATGTPSLAPLWQSTPATITTGIDLGDVDSDGDLDMVCSNWNAGNTLYLNTGDALDVLPAWESDLASASFGVALADFDRDGDLDAFYGNEGDVNALYEANGVVLGVSPTWLSTDEGSTFGVVPGDVDNDGDLDLACANGGFSFGANTLYQNDGNGLRPTPVWTAGSLGQSFSVALGDINGDSLLDLVSANAGAANTVNLNIGGGVFETSPSWFSSEANGTIVIDLGDVDGDGDLDLVCGNGGLTGERNTLYLNNGVMLDVIPAWRSPEANITVGVALGDIDQDGRPDLVCANNGQPNRIYLNNGTVFDTIPYWVSGGASFTFGVDVGDVDGDGDVDLVFGNGGFIDEANTLYINHGGHPSTLPDWSSDIAGSSTFGVALGDVDGDGDLDLLSGNESQRNTLYLNVGGPGVFTPSPVWRSGPASSTFGVAVADMDNDGDMDVVCANEAASNVIYSSLTRPPYKGDTTDPSAHLPNNATFLRSVYTNSVGLNMLQFRFDAVDVEGDGFYLVAEYQYRGEPNWSALDVIGYNARTGPFAATAGGVTDSVVVDLSRLAPDPRAVVVRLTAVSSPTRVGKIAQTASFIKDMGPIEAIVPRISVPAEVVFPTVTVGDTVSQFVVIDNFGSGVLQVDSIALPSGEMDVFPPTSFTVAPSASESLTVLVRPRNETSIIGDIVITSNDPVNPTLVVAQVTVIKSLVFTTELLAPLFDDLPLGQAVTARIIADDGVTIEKAVLYHRPGGAPVFGDSIVMTPVLPPVPPCPPPGPCPTDPVTEWIAVIPGSAVTETNLEYYVKVSNSGVEATDPPDAPSDSFFSRIVALPAGITSLPQATEGDDFLEGRGVRVLVPVPDGATFVSGQLHFRPGGDTKYDSLDLDPGEALPVATIPATMVGARGVEYWVEVQTLTKRLTDPATSPERSPLGIRVVVPHLIEPSKYPGGRYRMVSVPLVVPPGQTLEDMLSGQSDFGSPYNPARWRSFRYVPAAAAYEEVNAATEASHVTPGRGFWLISARDNRIDTAPLLGKSTPTDRPFDVALEPGWNQIGNPFNFAVAWDSVLVDGLRMSDATGTTVQGPHRWDVGTGDYDPVMASTLMPFEGYWVKNLTGSIVTLQVPTERAPAATASVTRQQDDEWRIGLDVREGEVRDRHNYAGVSPRADPAWDRLDVAEPPIGPYSRIALYFPHDDWYQQQDLYRVDTRGVVARTGDKPWGYLWRVGFAKTYVADRPGDKVTIEFSGAEGVPADARVVFIDHDLDRVIDLRQQTQYGFFAGLCSPSIDVSSARFTLIVGDEEFVASRGMPNTPSRTVLHQNRPNPFNPTTIVRYEIAKAGHVTIAVYSATGALVTTLFDGHRDPGVYEIAWNGRGGADQAVASGIYFCRLEASGAVETRKMVLLK